MPFLDYDLPPELIAQEPAAERDRARLLIVRRTDGSLTHHTFADLPELLAPGDLLVLNDTKVVSARLLGRRERTGGKWEGLFLRESDGMWEMLAQTRGTLLEGEVVLVEPETLATGVLPLTYLGRSSAGHFLFRPPPGNTYDLLARFGHVPLPPYIRKGLDQPSDAVRYQTVFAHSPGAVAAPTAGLHFTDRLFERLSERGIERTFVTLHVGLGTFQPLQDDDPARHVMHAEWCELPQSAVGAIARCQDGGGRVIAVGTTAVRTLETARGRPFRGETSLFIRPPYNFTAVDALITNFHLPRTSLLLLAGAFAGDDLLRRAYETAIAERYRFYSYGDAMLIL
jgi:S-adenosylmethionine:tRNA ribosyltransferase-isomerase